MNKIHAVNFRPQRRRSLLTSTVQSYKNFDARCGAAGLVIEISLDCVLQFRACRDPRGFFSETYSP